MQALASIIPSGMIHNISAVTFAVRDMARSVEFYRKLGFELVYGGERAEFSSLKAGAAFVNLAASPGYEHRWWSRAIFRVDDADAHHRGAAGSRIDGRVAARCAAGERFFHVTDPDGHE